MMDKAADSCYTRPRLMINKRILALAAGLGLAAAACTPPKYVEYRSVNGDFKTYVPWGWQIFTDQDGDGTAFASAHFVGPFDPQFHLGVPSVSVRWYRNYFPHMMRDGRLESYTGAEDFIKQTLKDVYGPDYELPTPVKSHTLQQSGLPATEFVVLSRAKVPETTRNGVEVDEDGTNYNVRMHGYTVVPVGDGFYVLTYPATRSGFNKYDESYYVLRNGFLPISAGPNGAKVRLPGPRRAP